MVNNRQTMAGLNANTVFYNCTTTIAMLAGRFGLAAFALTLAGQFPVQIRRSTTAGSLASDTPTFGALVFGATLPIWALSFFPFLALRPVVEFLLQ